MNKKYAIEIISWYNDVKDPPFSTEVVGMALDIEYTDRRVEVTIEELEAKPGALLIKVARYIEAARKAQALAESLY